MFADSKTPHAYSIRKLNDDVWIALPDEATGAELVSPPDSPTIPIEMATQDDFQLLRLIGELKFSGNDQDYFVFRPPARLQVRFTAEDLNRAQRRGKPLALAYWYEGRWVRLPYGNVPATPNPGEGDWANFIILEMPDPPIAWGM